MNATQTAQKSRTHWPLTLLMGGSSLLNLFLPLVLVRILEASQVGQYKLFFLYAATAPWLLMSAGFNSGLYFWAGQRSAQREAFSATWSLQMCWSLGILLVGAGLFPTLSLFPNSFLAEPWYFAFFVLSVAAGIPAQFYEEASIAQGHTRSAAWYSAGWDVLKSLVLLMTAYVTRSVDLMVMAFFIVVFAKLSVSSFLVLKNKYAEFSLRTNGQLKPVLRYAIPASLAAACGIVFGYCDQFILGQRLSAAAFAAYSLGCLSVPPLLIFEQSVNKVLLPQLSEAFVDSRARAMALFKKAVLDLGLWLVPAATGLFFFAGPITRLLFTDRYPETEGFLRAFSVSYLFLIMPYDVWARAKGLSGWMFRTTALFAVISFLATLIGATYYGAYGALGALLGTQLLLRLYGLTAMKRQLGWSLLEALPLNFLLLFVGVSLLLGIACSTAVGFFANETLGLIIMGTIFWILYVAMLVPTTLRYERSLLNSKNVLILTQYLNIGGLERMVLTLAQTLRRNGHWHPSVWVYDEIPGAQTLDAVFADIPVIRKHKGRGFSLKLSLQMAAYCRKNQIDVIHAHDLGALIYAVMTKFASLGRIQIVYTLHSFVHLKKSKKYTYYEMFFGFFADVITVVSPQLSEGFPSGVPFFKPKIHVVENGIQFPEPAASLAEKRALKEALLPGRASSVWILNLARLHPGKGQAEAMELWNRLPTEVRARCILIFVGGETSKDFRDLLEAKARTCETAANIIFTGGSLTPDRWLIASDLMISASLEEGLPLSPMEALAVGMPIFLSEIEGHRLLENYATTFSLKDMDAGASKLSALIGNVESRTALNVGSSAEILKRFSAARMTESYERFYADTFATSKERR